MTNRCIAIFAAILVALAGGPAPAGEPEQTALARALAAPGAQVSAVLAGAPLQGGAARAVVTALVVKIPGARGDPVRGARIDLSENDAVRSVFIDEGDLLAARRELDLLDCELERDAASEDRTHGVRGVERCRPSQAVAQAWCPAYVHAPGGDGLSVTTHAGHRFFFPGARPASLAAALGRVLAQFGLDEESVPPAMIALPDAVADRVWIAASEAHAELRHSTGIKAAGYMDPATADQVWALFWPHRRDGDFAQALVVDCAQADPTAGEWACPRAMGRGYLTLAGQPRPAVVMGAMGRDAAMGLIDLTRATVRAQDPHATWHAVSVRPADAAAPDHWIRWQSSAGADVTVIVDPSWQNDPGQGAAPAVRDNRTAPCGTRL